MWSKIKHLVKKESGNSIVMVALSLGALLSMTGLVIDGGTMYVTKSHLQKTANAAALSGAQELTNKEDEVRRVAKEVLERHGESESLENIKVQMEDRVDVFLTKPVDLNFVGIFGIEQADVKVYAAAEILPMNESTGMAPFSVPNNVPIRSPEDPEYDESEDIHTIKFKPGNDKDDAEVDKEGSTSDYGILSYEYTYVDTNDPETCCTEKDEHYPEGGSGNDRYRHDFKYGSESWIEIGDVVGVETGQNNKGTMEAMDYRWENCPYKDGSVEDPWKYRDCTRVILLPRTEDANTKTGTNKKYRVTGFAYFFIIEPYNNGKKEIKGHFVEKADTGYGRDGDKTENSGAFAIRLTE
ncbi:TadE/TadG family type IV pilus assembly protein [Caldalkalibacillus salinus]|uniref:TadE/TadG family type IV pilus assembly protein n=1 Tax=Caldalkalibacillus salinus TaxID=2803787 RepID=UPI00192188D2|nr:TadE/TadG family type IV pilus assembly protein [Caldalkalibacillus salinus]